jgi:radical SAM superfamily enzyme YgiQ (UPF0313 family)
VKILFVATKKNADPSDRELYEMDFLIGVLGFQRSLVDLGILTAAAATPSDVQIEVVDEYVQDIPWDTDADLVALSAKTSCAPHAYEVADEFRRRGKKVVLGGIHGSLRTEEALQHVDHVVKGEADKTWPRFVQLYQRGQAPQVMEEDGFPPMDEIPIPRWSELPHGDFMFHQVQTTRGCPFMCRFCSVPTISGNTFRFKPIEKVIHEILQMPDPGPVKRLGKPLYIVDDNFLSKVRYTKDLLKAMVPYRRQGKIPDFSAETTFNVALDDELLDLLRDAGCTTLIIGFESISEATLVSMDKKVNFCLPFAEGIKKIHDRGIAVMGNFIVGFDTDTLAVFEDTLKFIDDNDIVYPFFSILTPMPGTQLHEDYKAEGRLDHYDWSRYDTRHVVMEPKHMTREQLQDGYCYLYEQAYFSDRAIDRLQRYWKKFPGRRANVGEKAYVAARLTTSRSWWKGTEEFRAFLRRAWRRAAMSGAPVELGQLLYAFDSAHFADYLKRFRSTRYAEHARVFRDPPQTVVSVDPRPQAYTPAAQGEQPAPLVQLSKKQWESDRAQKRVARAAPTA